jgi:transketolase
METRSSTQTPTELTELCINTLRTLAMDAVQKANSGHPGTPMGAAPMAFALWTRFLRHNPRNPKWPDRDRFVLSAGHASILLYSLLHLSGYDLPLAELQRFRQWASMTPGHPEYGHTPGVEATTGPLGQGFADGIGMAIAEQFLAAHFNRPEHEVINHHVYGIVSDGDLMEGISSEAASLAGHLGLGKVVYLYDDNDISIEGDTSLTFTEQVGKRFEAYGWQVLRADGNDVEAISAAIEAARQEEAKPSLIVVSTEIGYGSPHKQGTAAAHGAPLGEEEVRLTKRALGWPEEPAFFIPDEALAEFRKAVSRGREMEEDWDGRFSAYAAAFPTLAELFDSVMAGGLPAGWDRDLPTFSEEDGPMATRQASGKVLNTIAANLPTLIGGSADLAPSTSTHLKGYGDFGFDEWAGHNMHFGVREHAMGGIVNGMALHGGVIPYGATFLVFSDYMRPAIRLASLMRCHSIFIFTHDSIGLGEDGPTHQPIEHLASLRAMPQFTVLRPADANETAACWRLAVERGGPAALILTRQSVPTLTDASLVTQGARRGAYVLAGEGSVRPDILLIATGSEVSLAVRTREILAGHGLEARVISMPSWEVFEEQEQSYKDAILPPAVKTRLSIEAGASFGWARYVGDEGKSIAVDHFGASAPGPVVMQELGFTPEAVAEQALKLITERSSAGREGPTP